MQNMMTIEFTLLTLAIIGFISLRWAFKHLPEERWQFFDVLPIARTERGWQGVNITYYGIISALAYCIAIALFVFLCGAAKQSALLVSLFLAGLLAVAIPASKLIARWVEGSRATFTVSGALFVTCLVSPAVFYAVNALGHWWNVTALHAPAVIAAATISYCLGEAVGRLGCLSFGCCYGKPLADAGPIEQLIYARTATTYRGSLKKIAYASNLESVPVIAVQSVASVVLFALCLIGLWLFWSQSFAAALVVSLGGSQVWRVYSESLRADDRGETSATSGFTAYQWMALLTTVVTLIAAWRLSELSPTMLVATSGFDALLRADVVFALQLLFIGIVWFMGRSTVTGAHLQLLLFREKL
jgi:hypothetical protein